MRIRLAILLLTGTLILLGCSKTEQPEDYRHGKIPGRWRLSELGTDTNRNGKLDQGERYKAMANIEEEYFSDGTGKAYLNNQGQLSITDLKWVLRDNAQTMQVITNYGKVDEITLLYPIVSLSQKEFIRKYKSSTDSGFAILIKD